MQIHLSAGHGDSDLNAIVAQLVAARGKAVKGQPGAREHRGDKNSSSVKLRNILKSGPRVGGVERQKERITKGIKNISRGEGHGTYVRPGRI